MKLFHIIYSRFNIKIGIHPPSPLQRGNSFSVSDQTNSPFEGGKGDDKVANSYFKKKPLKSSNYLICCLLLLTVACNDSNSTASTTEQARTKNALFDLKAFMTTEIASLTDSNTNLEKEIKFREATEKQTLPQPDWNKELMIFSNSTINKAAWLDKFEVDSSATLVHYKCISPKIKTQDMKLFLGPDKAITRIEIENKTGNFLYDSDELLKYDKVNKRYSIERNQQVLFGDEERIEIKGTFFKLPN